MRKVTLFIAVSLDGYIARSDGGIEWLSKVERPGEDYGYEEFMKTIDTVLIGRKTFEKVSPDEFISSFGERNCYVITRQEKKSERNIIFTNMNPADLVRKLKQSEGKNIYCCGGSEIIQILMKNDQIDEFIISVIPLLLGKGIRLFGDFGKKTDLRLIRSTSFISGLVQNHYRRK
jgi:dihydrofolate reductase